MRSPASVSPRGRADGRASARASVRGDARSGARARGVTAPPRETPPAPPQPHARVSPAISALILILSLVGCVHATVMLTIEIQRYRTSEREIRRLSATVAELQAQAAALLEIGSREDDVAYRTQLARHANFLYPDEIRYVVVPNR
jgi:cell division protein FtsB